MASNAELLAEAREARRRILIGGAALEVRDGNSGDSIRYSPANLSALERYIRELETAISGAQSVVNRPLRLTF